MAIKKIKINGTDHELQTTVSNITDLTATATELNYMDGVTSNVQTQLNGKAASSHTHNYAGSSSAGGAATSANKLNTNAGDSNTPVYFSSGVPVACTSLDLNTTGNASTATTATTAKVSESDKGITTGGTGSAYTAVVEGITALSAGVTFIMIPNTVSTTTAPTLNVNSLGAKTVRRRLSAKTGTTVAGSASDWLTASKPVRVTYDGTYWVIDSDRPSATDIYGSVSIRCGGTGATTAAAARSNLGAMADVAVTSSDAGKFLRVNSSGVWAAETVPSAESTSF